jgi:hypothetical protein
MVARAYVDAVVSYVGEATCRLLKDRRTPTQNLFQPDHSPPLVGPVVDSYYGHSNRSHHLMMIVGIEGSNVKRLSAVGYKTETPVRNSLICYHLTYNQH